MTRRWLTALVCIAAAAPVAAQQRPSDTPNRPQFYALQNVRVVPVSGAVVENGTVVVANGLIEAVGANVTPPPDAWVIDGSGLTVYPGLFDGLSTVGLESPQRGAQGGGGGNPFGGDQDIAEGPEDRPATTSWVSAADQLDPEAGSIGTWREGGYTSALVAPDDGIVTGQAAVINLAGDAQEMVVRTPAALRVTMNPAGGFRSYPGSLMGVISYVRQLYEDAAHQTAYEASYRDDPRGQPRPKYDRALEPIQDAIAGGWPTILPADEVKEIRRAIRLGERTGARPVIAGAQDAWEIAEELAAAGVPVLVDLDWPEAARDGDPEADESLQSLRRRAYAPTTPARLEEAGVTWAFYSGGASNPREVKEKVRTAIENGLSEQAALRALTLSPARIFGVDALLGSIEPGKLANLVVTDGDLFEEDTEVRMVFVDGRKFEEPAEERPTEAPAVDMTGTWILSLNNDSQEATAELTMDEDGNLSGQIIGERGEQQITGGWVSGNSFSITVSARMGPRTVEATYTGTVEDDQLEGSVSFGSFSMDFTGQRDPGGN